MASFNAYKLRQQVEGIITSCGGIIFGGHVRDVVLHDTHAAEYYKESGDDGAKMYEDASFMPQYGGRLVISSDIDCYMIAHSIESFMDQLRDENLSVQVVFEREDAKQYIPTLDVPHGVLRHVRLSVSSLGMKVVKYIRELVNEGLSESARTLVSREVNEFVCSLHRASLACPTLFLDVFVADCRNFYAMCPPFGTVDFECNGLILTASGITLSPSLFPGMSPLQRNEVLQRIIDDIKNKRASYVNTDMPDDRVAKMCKKGWSIVLKHVHVNAERPADADVCIFCHDEVRSQHFKLKCCNAIYHKDCLVKVLSSEYGDKCIMCKRKTLAYMDVVVLAHS